MTDEQVEQVEPERTPLIVEDSTVLIDFRDEVQRAFQQWFGTKWNELAEVLKPFGITDVRDVAMPTLQRLLWQETVGERNLGHPRSTATVIPVVHEIEPGAKE